MECFLCKKTGHIASSCPSPNGPINRAVPEASTSKATEPIETIQSPHIQPTGTEAVATVHKRGRAEMENYDRNSISNTGTKDAKIMPPPSMSSTSSHPSKKVKNKKIKVAKSLTTEYELSEETRNNIAEIYAQKRNEFIIPIDNFYSFLENTYSCQNPYVEALKYTDNIKSLLENIYLIYPSLTERAMKNRFTRLSKKIKAQWINDKSDSESISSLPSIQSSADSSDEDNLSETSQMSQKSTTSCSPKDVQADPVEL